MIQDFTLHTHTLGFDGKNTIAEMATVAENNGMEFIGISNHFIVHPDIKKTKFYPFAVAGGYSRMYNADFKTAILNFQKHKITYIFLELILHLIQD